MARSWSRRHFLITAALAGAALRAPALLARPQEPTAASPVLRRIPATGEAIPAIGMGTWITFNVGGDAYLIDQRTEVLRTFFELGGTVVDCSPMYGSSAEVVGQALATLGAEDRVFAASKVWTGDESATRSQTQASRQRWGLARFDLQQVHNLLGWQGHLETLKEMKAEGRVRYIGITTSHGRRHRDLEQIMGSEPLDFVQLTYNVVDREAEQRLLPLARERGIAVLANRPFQRGALFDRYQHEPLPPWAADAGISNWSEFFLKFIISHPAVTCVIPATSQVDHMHENMGAMYGPLPDAGQRQRMADYVRSL